MVNMYSAQFGASVQCRENLAGIEPVSRVKGTFEALLLFQVCFGKHFGHQVPFLNTNPVFSR